MGRQVEFGSLGLFSRFNACAHSCRYCCMANKKFVDMPLPRLARLIERFALWRDETRPGFTLAIGTGYSSEEDLESFKIFKKLGKRIGRDFGRMHLGGLKMRSESETHAWLTERFNLGTHFANASYAGTFDVHDHWNRRRGDFQHLLQLQRIAAEIGMELGQYMFVARSTFSHLDSLLDHLEALPKQAIERSLIVVGYIGWARQEEKERILEEDRDRLPARLKPFQRNADQWKSEREWIETESGDDMKKDFMLRLDIDEANIAQLETMSCDAIVEDLEMRKREAYARLPTWDELRDRNGDKSNRRIYASRDEMERKWLDAHLEKYPIELERRLTHLMSSF